MPNALVTVSLGALIVAQGSQARFRCQFIHAPLVRGLEPQRQDGLGRLLFQTRIVRCNHTRQNFCFNHAHGVNLHADRRFARPNIHCSLSYVESSSRRESAHFSQSLFENPPGEGTGPTARGNFPHFL